MKAMIRLQFFMPIAAVLPRTLDFPAISRKKRKRNRGEKKEKRGGKEIDAFLPRGLIFGRRPKKKGEAFYR